MVDLLKEIMLNFSMINLLLWIYKNNLKNKECKELLRKKLNLQ